MSDAANLPALRLPSGVSEEQQQFNRSVLQWIQMREGQQGNSQERVLLQRDLAGLGIGAGGIGNSGALPANALAQLATRSRAEEFAAFAAKIIGTRVFQNLMAGANDSSRFSQLDQRLRDLLETSIAEKAAQIGTAISRIDETIQNEREQRATVIQELTTKAGSQVAGLRMAQSVTVANGKATAAQVTQLQSRLDDADGHGATVEEVLLTVADQISGLLAQWSLKVTAGGAWAGIGLSAESPLVGPGDSAIILAANRLAFVQETDVLGTGPGQVDPANPGATRIPFGIDSDGVIYLNGQVRINANGAPLQTLAKTLNVTAPTQVFKQDTAGNWDASTITLTGAKLNGLTGVPAWTVLSGAYTGALTAGNTLAVTRANMTSDSVTFRGSVTDGGATYTDDITIVKLVDGKSTLSGYLSNESHTVPTDSVGNVSSFVGAGGAFKVFNGTADVTAACAYTVLSNPQGVTVGLDNTGGAGSYSVSATGAWPAGTRVATVTLRMAHALGNIDKVFTITKSVQGVAGTNGANGANGANGLRGSVQSYYQRPAPGWSDVDATNRTFQVSGTGYLVGGDTATQSYSNTWAETRYWTGGAWVTPGVVIDGNLLVRGSITATNGAIGDLAVTTLNIQNNAVTVPSGSVLASDTGTFSAMTTILAGINIDTGGQPLAVMMSLAFTVSSGGAQKPIAFYVKINGITRATLLTTAPFMSGSMSRQVYIASPGTGNLAITIVADPTYDGINGEGAGTGGSTCNCFYEAFGGCSVVAIGMKK